MDVVSERTDKEIDRKNIWTLDFPNPFQTERLPIVGAKFELVSCRCWCASRYPSGRGKKFGSKKFRPGPHTVPMQNKSMLRLRVKVRVNTTKWKISTY
jgi:hypothetical protein